MSRSKEQNEAGKASEPDFSSRLLEAREQLDLLREQQETIEREKNQLEELKGLTEELEISKRNISERMGAAISVLEKKEHELRMAQQEALSVKNELENAADEIQIAAKKSQKIDDVRDRVAFEKQAIESAGNILEKASAKLDFLGGEEYDFEEEEDLGGYGREFPDFSGFMEGFKSGVGFFAAGLIAAVVFYIIFLVTGR